MKTTPPHHDFEVIVKGSNNPALTARTLKETVEAVNRAIGRDDIRTARKLPSGDVILTTNNRSSEWCKDKDEGWVHKAFGEGVQLSRRTYVVLAKGFQKEDLEKDISQTIEEISETNKVKIVRGKPYRKKTSVFGMMILEVESIEEANKLYLKGTVLSTRIYRTEPFNPELSLR